MDPTLFDASWFEANVYHNEFLWALVGAAALVALRNVPSTLWTAFQKRFSLSLSINSEDQVLYKAAYEWLLSQGFSRWGYRFRVRQLYDEQAEDPAGPDGPRAMRRKNDDNRDWETNSVKLADGLVMGKFETLPCWTDF